MGADVGDVPDDSRPAPDWVPQDHEAVSVGPFGYAMQCVTCQTICLPDFETRQWRGPAGDPWPGGHFYDFPDADRLHAEAAGGDNRLHAEALGSPETEREPDTAPTSTPDAFEAPDPGPAAVQAHIKAQDAQFRAAMLNDPEYLAAKADRAGKRRSAKAALNPSLANTPDGRSRFSRTKEYRKIEMRRTRARARGLDPDTMGPEFKLPRRSAFESMIARGVRRSLGATGVFAPGELDDLDLRELAD